MIPAARKKQFLLVASLVTLILRASAPDGYMVGSAESGLLFELCPEGMPAGFLQVLTGEANHAHHGGDDSSTASVSSSQCSIGHMLTPFIAMDADSASIVTAARHVSTNDPVTTIFRLQVIRYRTRAPPA